MLNAILTTVLSAWIVYHMGNTKKLCHIYYIWFGSSQEILPLEKKPQG